MKTAAKGIRTERRDDKADALSSKSGKTKSSAQHLKLGLYEDCDFYRIPDERKRKGFRTISIYTGTVYRADQTASRRILYRIGLSLLLAADILLFLLCGTRPVSYNLVSWLGIAEGLALISLVYTAAVWCIYLTAEQEMRAYLYRMTSQKLIIWSRVSGGLLATDAVLILAYYAANLRNVSVGFPAPAFGFALCSAGMFLIAFLEKRVRYETRRSTERPPENAEKLDWSSR